MIKKSGYDWDLLSNEEFRTVARLLTKAVVDSSPARQTRETKDRIQAARPTDVPSGSNTKAATSPLATDAPAELKDDRTPHRALRMGPNSSDSPGARRVSIV
jgi:hypothetical protein